MANYLKALAVVVAVLGALAGIVFLRAVGEGSEEYRRAELLRERNPGSMPYELEFGVAQSRRVFLVYSAAGSLLIAVVGGSLLWGLGSLHAKVDRTVTSARE